MINCVCVTRRDPPGGFHDYVVEDEGYDDGSDVSDDSGYDVRKFSCCR